MNAPDPERDPAGDALRRLLSAVDDAIAVPPGLWDRVRTRPATKVSRARWVPVAATAAILVVMAVAFAAGAVWQRQQRAPASSAAGSVRVDIYPGAVSSSGPGDQTCGTGSSNNSNVTTCIVINTTGQKINSVVVSASVKNSPRALRECLRGPSGTIGCSQFQSVSPGHTLALTWTPRHDEPAGQYCANTVRLAADGSQPEIGAYCVQMHG